MRISDDRLSNGVHDLHYRYESGTERLDDNGIDYFSEGWVYFSNKVQDARIAWMEQRGRFYPTTNWGEALKDGTMSITMRDGTSYEFAVSDGIPDFPPEIEIIKDPVYDNYHLMIKDEDFGSYESFEEILSLGIVTLY